MSSVKWPTPATKSHTGTEITYELEGLPEGVTAVYSGNKATDIGTYTAVVESLKYNAKTHKRPELPKGVTKSKIWTIE